MFSKLISTLSALIHLDGESPKVPFFCGSGHVRFAIRTFRHNPSPFKVKGRITIYHFHDGFASKFHVHFVKRTPLFVTILVSLLVRQKLRRKDSVGPLPRLKCTVNINSLHFNVLAFWTLVEDCRKVWLLGVVVQLSLRFHFSFTFWTFCHICQPLEYYRRNLLIRRYCARY
jgi:hypothetical protein